MPKRGDLSNHDISTLEGMFFGLRPHERLRFMERLTGDAALKTFFEDLARRQDEYKTGLDIVKTEAKETGSISPNRIPADAQVTVFLGTVDLARLALRPSTPNQKLQHNRYVMFRSLGGGLFKFLGNRFANNNVSAPPYEGIRRSQVVQIGTVIHQGRRDILQPEIRTGESLAMVAENQPPTVLAINVRRTGVVPVGVTTVDIGDDRILPARS